MTATIIGITSGLFIILLFTVLKQLDKKLIYALILTGIGFLYVGFTWTDLSSLIITALQAVCFLFLAYYGAKRNLLFLAAGYFLHGLWDLGYDLLRLPNLIPPHYDLFCLSIDFTMGAYLLILKFRLTNKNRHLKTNQLSV
jgi:hypothetical protein